ncbi:hypothetical protein LFYK43_10740 [Ligilactobacillus salitolerans]|uniref:Antirepressor protein C-terminal domain-containing protein n=1 Tax=Ligilactobacillus salitolerans TaxID=1808352 RepID=A0A401ISZ5_9LACO|nr:phage regulatory protein/antirepressor Ant [Ligilactobacillus salitolerans]GBG94615.1 hypothetical protein LFYK43_10740 [Ligilactobacillus salitolerans]
MNNLAAIKTDMTIESREVAKMISKRHDHLVRDIQGYINDISENPNLGTQDFFIESSYKSEGNNKTYPCYLLTKKGCEFVANKMTGKKGNLFTASYITKFNQMEQSQPVQQYQIPQTLPEALRLAADEAETIEAQKKQIEHDRPLAMYTEIILKNPGLTKTSVIAKNYGMSAATFNELLHQLHIQYRQGNDWMLYAEYQNKGYTHSEPFAFKHKDGTKDVKYSMKWTQEGQKFLYDRLKEVGIVPAVERMKG